MIRLAAWLATSAPIVWAYRWHRRVCLASAASLLDDEPLNWQDVTPFRANAAEIDDAISEINAADLWGESLPPILTPLAVEAQQQLRASLPAGITAPDRRGSTVLPIRRA